MWWSCGTSACVAAQSARRSDPIQSASEAGREGFAPGGQEEVLQPVPLVLDVLHVLGRFLCQARIFGLRPGTFLLASPGLGHLAGVSLWAQLLIVCPTFSPFSLSQGVLQLL